MSRDLAAANAGAGCLEPGWRLVAEEDERRVVQRAGLRLWVTDEEIEAGAEAPRIGDLVAVRLAAGLPAARPGSTPRAATAASPPRALCCSTVSTSTSARKARCPSSARPRAA